MIIPPSTSRRPQFREGMSPAQGLVARKQQGCHGSPGLPDPGWTRCLGILYARAVSQPTNPVKELVALSHFTVEETEAERAKSLAHGHAARVFGSTFWTLPLAVLHLEES